MRKSVRARGRREDSAFRHQSVEEEKLYMLQVRKCDEASRASTQKEGVEEVVISRLLFECFGRVLTSFVAYLFVKWSWILLKEEDKLFGKIVLWLIILFFMTYQILAICQGAFLEVLSDR